MNKKMAAVLVTALGLLLLVYSGWRSLDFIMLTLPEGQRVLAIFGLAALDGGLILWLMHFVNSARGAWQRGIALLMVIVDFLGAVLLFTTDTLYRTGESGLTTQLTPQAVYFAVLALSAIIALNIGASVATHLTHPETRKAMAAEDAMDRIEDETIKQITQNAPGLAAELAPQLAADWVNRTRARYAALLSGSYDQPTTIDGEVKDKPSANGKRAHVYAAEAEAIAPSPKDG